MPILPYSPLLKGLRHHIVTLCLRLIRYVVEKNMEKVFDVRSFGEWKPGNMSCIRPQHWIMCWKDIEMAKRKMTMFSIDGDLLRVVCCNKIDGEDQTMRGDFYWDFVHEKTGRKRSYIVLISTKTSYRRQMTSDSNDRWPLCNT